MIISVDTELMNAMAAAVNSADLELESCGAVLARVVEHDDWNCPERDAINEAIRTLKQRMKTLMEGMEQFAHGVRQIAQQFNAIEQEIPAGFQSLDIMLGRLSAVTAGTAASNTVASGVTGSISAAVHPAAKLESYAAGNLNEDIRVCRFSDFMPQNN